MNNPDFAVSCIIPVYNEAARLGAVLDAVALHPQLAEVIVVDDASSDASAELAAATPGVRVIRQPVNGGKSRALAAGIDAAQSAHLLLLDGDLVGLTPAHVSALIAPVASGRADISISLRGNAPGLWRLLGIDYISGERVLARRLLDESTQALHGLPRFGFEVHLNALCIQAGARIGIVPWPEVNSPSKNRKYGLGAGLGADLAMMADIFRTVPPHRVLAQILAMRRQRV
ncbi:MAG: glycosyltransferase [Rhodobacteraceae bacterium]|nr:glycosyltransferase [Paracoccaceae bacterium]